MPGQRPRKRGAGSYRKPAPSGPVTTPAKVTACSGCAAPALAAHDDGVPVLADLAAVAPAEELAALIEGRMTYDVRRRALGVGAWLTYRDSLRIMAPDQAHAVVVEHRCVSRRAPGTRLPRYPAELAGELLGLAARVELGDDPPF